MPPPPAQLRLPDFIIPGNPVIKKNSRPIYVNGTTGKPFLGKSPKLKEAEQAAVKELKLQCADIIDPLPVSYRVHIRFLFFRDSRREADLSNLCEFPQDCLQEAGILQNDHLIESLDGSRKLYDPDYPRTEIYIDEITERSRVASEEHKND